MKLEAVSGEVTAVSGKVEAVSGKVEAVSGKVEAVSADVATIRTEMQAEDAASFQSPSGKQYGRLVDTKVDEWLAVSCGLQVTTAGRRGIAETDAAARAPGAPLSDKMQWDARFSVTCIRGWAAPPAGTSGQVPMYVYGGRASFAQPQAPSAPRTMTPTKPGHVAEYFAVLEYTRLPSWTYTTTVTKDDGTVVTKRKSLLPRLEKRLHVCMERFKAAGNTCATVLEAVALVGVVGEDACVDSVDTRLAATPPEFPLLSDMFKAGRFVFFFCAPMIPMGHPVLAQGGTVGTAAGAAPGT